MLTKLVSDKFTVHISRLHKTAMVITEVNSPKLEDKWDAKMILRFLFVYTRHVSSAFIIINKQVGSHLHLELKLISYPDSILDIKQDIIKLYYI